MASPGWVLGFYDFQRDLPSLESLIPGLGDLYERARQNGARQGTPYFLDPSGRADSLVNAFWRCPPMRGRALSTKRRYAFSLKVWLDFLFVIDSSWRDAGRDELASFKEWRLSAELNGDCIEPSSFIVDRAAIRGFYEWVKAQAGVENPVSVRVITNVFGVEVEEVEGTPSGIRRADVKWLTPEAFRLWLTVGLRGFTAAGLPSPRWKGRTEDRDVAYAEGLFATGLRNREWASQLIVELPTALEHDLLRGHVAAKTAKRSKSRAYWLRRRAAQMVRFYLEEGSRPAAVARAQRAGRYDAIPNKWLLLEVRSDRVLRVVNERGELQEVSLDQLTPEIRMRLFQEGEHGVEPVWLWLNMDGTPRPPKAWNKTFTRANERVAKTLGPTGLPLWCRPHMLRHSFALRWYCIATFVTWQRAGRLTEQEQRDFRREFGSIWFMLSTLLGHRSAETTREIYLEPFDTLQIEQILALMDADDRGALERLVEVIGLREPRVLTGVAS
ncbi:integrase [Streptomyces regensis]|nr:integrase [Streptomyces regensis]